MINDAHTTNSGSGNQGQDGNQNTTPTLEKRVASLKASGRWIDRIEKKATLIKLRHDLDKEIPNVQAELESYNRMDPKSDPVLKLEQMEGKEIWQKQLSLLEKYRGDVTSRASELLKSDAKGTK